MCHASMYSCRHLTTCRPSAVIVVIFFYPPLPQRNAEPENHGNLQRPAGPELVGTNASEGRHAAGATYARRAIFDARRRTASRTWTRHLLLFLRGPHRPFYHRSRFRCGCLPLQSSPSTHVPRSRALHGIPLHEHTLDWKDIDGIKSSNYYINSPALLMHNIYAVYAFHSPNIKHLRSPYEVSTKKGNQRRHNALPGTKRTNGEPEGALPATN